MRKMPKQNVKPEAGGGGAGAKRDARTVMSFSEYSQTLHKNVDKSLVARVTHLIKSHASKDGQRQRDEQLIAGAR